MRPLLSLGEEVTRVIEQIRVAAHKNKPDTIDRLTDELTTLTAVWAEPGPAEDWQHLGLTPFRGRVAEVMRRNLGRIVSREKIMNALYFARAGDEPHHRTIDVFICGIRKTLKGKFDIETVNGLGWRMTEAKTVDQSDGPPYSETEWNNWLHAKGISPTLAKGRAA